VCCRSLTASFGLVTYDARDPDTKFPPVEPLRPPEGAPNVLVILLDDVGFGAPSARGITGTGGTRTPEPYKAELFSDSDWMSSNTASIRAR
jgi:hypothetical protein